jgi:hypothetical protein
MNPMSTRARVWNRCRFQRKIERDTDPSAAGIGRGEDYQPSGTKPVALKYVLHRFSTTQTITTTTFRRQTEVDYVGQATRNGHTRRNDSPLMDI